MIRQLSPRATGFLVGLLLAMSVGASMAQVSVSRGSSKPGGSDTQVQFNDGGVFGGDSGLTFNKTTDALTVAGVGSFGGLSVTKTLGGGDSGGTFAVTSGGFGTNYGVNVTLAPSGLPSLSAAIRGINSLATIGSGAAVYGGITAAGSGDDAAGSFVGLRASALNANASGKHVAGYFDLTSGGATPTFPNAALAADNGATTSDIFVARDNGTAVFTVADGGNVTLAGLLGFGGTTSSFPALKRNSATLEVRLADDSAYAALNAATVKTGAVAVASLGTCNAAAKGTRHFVTDASATTFASTVAGGGANNVPVVCDGTNWIIG